MFGLPAYLAPIDLCQAFGSSDFLCLLHIFQSSLPASTVFYSTTCLSQLVQVPPGTLPLQLTEVYRRVHFAQFEQQLWPH